MANDRPPIPEGIKRSVRQRCGFGCVVCGLPLYEYEHMEGYANVQRHLAKEITLLCDQHHREKTSGLLPVESVLTANTSPFNLQTGVSTPYSLHYAGPTCRATIGSNNLTASTAGDFVAIMIDDLPLVGFRFEDGHCLLNVKLFDAANELILEITDNELVYSIEPWDVEFVGTRLTVRVASRAIFIDIQFDPPDGINLERGRILYNGVELLIHPDYMLLVNNNTLFMSCSTGNFPGGSQHRTRHAPSSVRLSNSGSSEIRGE